ncbi:MAG: TfoX/Sxy family DNA transformation protein [Longimicrobiales bacterium]
MSSTRAELTELPNIGSTIAKRLRDVGIHSVRDLENVGAAGAYLALCAKARRRLPVCYYLYTLEGALRSLRWTALSPDEKDRLQRQVAEQGSPQRVAKARSKRAIKTNAEWSAETRVAILQAARDGFSRSGYAGTSLEAVAEAASITKGAIYHHFPNKQRLFRAVYEEVQREMVARIEAVAQRAASPFQGISSGCAAFLEAVLERGTARIVLIDAPAVLGLSTWRAVDNELGGRSLREGVQAAMRAGQLVRTDAAALTSLLSGALNEAALVIAESKNPAHTRRVVRSALMRLLHGLRTGGPKNAGAARARS